MYHEENFELDESIEDLLKEEEPKEVDNSLRARYSHGPIRKGDKIEIMERGPDWFGVKNNGRVVRVPRYVVYG